ncbi:unnamed protein product [Amoebophrya sp. A120]|nr:unnamed protein product [Amoebophrya sp. A120]|eukprot:GSA120T00017482001.1
MRMVLRFLFLFSVHGSGFLGFLPPVFCLSSSSSSIWFAGGASSPAVNRGRGRPSTGSRRSRGGRSGAERAIAPSREQGSSSSARGGTNATAIIIPGAELEQQPRSIEGLLKRTGTTSYKTVLPVDPVTGKVKLPTNHAPVVSRHVYGLAYLGLTRKIGTVAVQNGRLMSRTLETYKFPDVDIHYPVFRSSVQKTTSSGSPLTTDGDHPPWLLGHSIEPGTDWTDFYAPPSPEEQVLRSERQSAREHKARIKRGLLIRKSSGAQLKPEEEKILERDDDVRSDTSIDREELASNPPEVTRENPSAWHFHYVDLQGNTFPLYSGTHDGEFHPLDEAEAGTLPTEPREVVGEEAVRGAPGAEELQPSPPDQLGDGSALVQPTAASANSAPSEGSGGGAARASSRKRASRRSTTTSTPKAGKQETLLNEHDETVKLGTVREFMESAIVTQAVGPFLQHYVLHRQQKHVHTGMMRLQDRPFRTAYEQDGRGESNAREQRRLPFQPRQRVDFSPMRAKPGVADQVKHALLRAPPAAKDDQDVKRGAPDQEDDEEEDQDILMYEGSRLKIAEVHVFSVTRPKHGPVGVRPVSTSGTRCFLNEPLHLCVQRATDARFRHPGLLQQLRAQQLISHSYQHPTSPAASRARPSSRATTPVAADHALSSGNRTMTPATTAYPSGLGPGRPTGPPGFFVRVTLKADRVHKQKASRGKTMVYSGAILIQALFTRAVLAFTSTRSTFPPKTKGKMNASQMHLPAVPGAPVNTLSGLAPAVEGDSEEQRVFETLESTEPDDHGVRQLRLLFMDPVTSAIKDSFFLDTKWLRSERDKLSPLPYQMWRNLWKHEVYTLKATQDWEVGMKNFFIPFGCMSGLIIGSLFLTGLVQRRRQKKLQKIQQAEAEEARRMRDEADRLHRRKSSSSLMKAKMKEARRSSVSSTQQEHLQRGERTNQNVQLPRPEVRRNANDNGDEQVFVPLTPRRNSTTARNFLDRGGRKLSRSSRISYASKNASASEKEQDKDCGHARTSSQKYNRRERSSRTSEQSEVSSAVAGSGHDHPAQHHGRRRRKKSGSSHFGVLATARPAPPNKRLLDAPVPGTNNSSSHQYQGQEKSPGVAQLRVPPQFAGTTKYLQVKAHPDYGNFDQVGEMLTHRERRSTAVAPAVYSLTSPRKSRNFRSPSPGGSNTTEYS